MALADNKKFKNTAILFHSRIKFYFRFGQMLILFPKKMTFSGRMRFDILSNILN